MNALSDLHLAWREYRVQHPSVRIRDGAAALGVSEAELPASDVGESETALAKPAGKTGWGAVIEALPTLGRVMALTRNEHCVHAGVFAVLHDLNLVAQYADDLVAMRQGQVVARGTPGEMIDAKLLNDVFGLSAMVLQHPYHGWPLVVPA